MIRCTFPGSEVEPPEYVSDNEAYCATPKCSETLDQDEEGHLSLFYDGRVCDPCHEAEMRREARQNRNHSIFLAAPDWGVGAWEVAGEY